MRQLTVDDNFTGVHLSTVIPCLCAPSISSALRLLSLTLNEKGMIFTDGSFADTDA